MPWPAKPAGEAQLQRTRIAQAGSWCPHPAQALLINDPHLKRQLIQTLPESTTTASNRPISSSSLHIVSRVTLINASKGLNLTIDCGGKLISGSVDQEDPFILREDQIDAGVVLTCVAIPTSDCTIETHTEQTLY